MSEEERIYTESIVIFEIIITENKDLTNCTVDFFVLKPTADGELEVVEWEAIIDDEAEGVTHYVTSISPDFELDYAGYYIFHPHIIETGGDARYSRPVVFYVYDRHEI